MRDYLVLFHALVPDGGGCPRSVLRRRTVVSAPSEVSAAFAAKAMFSLVSGIADWRMGADTCEVVALPTLRRDAPHRPGGAEPIPGRLLTPDALAPA